MLADLWNMGCCMLGGNLYVFMVVVWYLICYMLCGLMYLCGLLYGIRAIIYVGWCMYYGLLYGM